MLKYPVSTALSFVLILLNKMSPFVASYFKLIRSLKEVESKELATICEGVAYTMPLSARFTLRLILFERAIVSLLNLDESM